jgi:hypothetical protein
MAPKPGDVVVSRHVGECEYDVAVVPSPPQIVCATHGQAVSRACLLARQLKVDAWLTDDHTHFLRLACHRSGSRALKTALAPAARKSR